MSNDKDWRWEAAMAGSKDNHESSGRHYVVARNSERSLGVLFAVVCAVVGGWPLLAGDQPVWWLLGTAAVFLASGLLFPVVLKPINIAWNQLGKLLERIVNPVIFGVLFYLVVAPMGLVMRLLGKNPLALDFDSKATSYWIERDPPGPEPETMRDQF